MNAPARNPLDDIVRKLVACIRLLSSDKEFEIAGAMAGIQRLLKGADTSTTRALADRIEGDGSGGVDEKFRDAVRAQIVKAREVGYAEGVRAAEARFRPSGKFEFSEVALCVERQINRFPPDKHEFIHKMALYAAQGFEPSPKQGRFLFDLFLQYLGGRIT
jgi:hypothetical protein